MRNKPRLNCSCSCGRGRISAKIKEHSKRKKRGKAKEGEISVQWCIQRKAHEENRVSFQLVFCPLSSAVFYRQHYSLSCRRTAMIILGENWRILLSRWQNSCWAVSCTLPLSSLPRVAFKGGTMGAGVAGELHSCPQGHHWCLSYPCSSNHCMKRIPSRLSPFLCWGSVSTSEQQPPHQCFLWGRWGKGGSPEHTWLRILYQIFPFTVIQVLHTHEHGHEQIHTFPLSTVINTTQSTDPPLELDANLLTGKSLLQTNDRDFLVTLFWPPRRGEPPFKDIFCFNSGLSVLKTPKI